MLPKPTALSDFERGNSEPREFPEKFSAIFARIQNAAEIARQPEEKVEYDVDQLLQADDAPFLLFGPPETLKSWIMIALCEAMVRGEPFLGFATRRRPSALYLNIDAGPKTFRNRIRRYASSAAFEVLKLEQSECGAELFDALFARHRGGFVVIDCFANINKPQRGVEPGQAARDLGEDLKALYARHGCGGGVVDHAHRPKSPGDSVDYYGDVQKQASLRTMWAIAAPRGKGRSEPLRRLTLSCRKPGDGPGFDPIEAEIDFSGQRVVLRRCGHVADDSKATGKDWKIRRGIMDWARQQLKSFSRRQACAAISGADADVRAAFDALRDEGMIVVVPDAQRGGYPTYRAADPRETRAPVQASAGHTPEPAQHGLPGCVSMGVSPIKNRGHDTPTETGTPRAGVAGVSKCVSESDTPEDCEGYQGEAADDCCDHCKRGYLWHVENLG